MAKKRDAAAGPSVSPASDSDDAPPATPPETGDAAETPPATGDASKTSTATSDASKTLSRLADSARTEATGIWQRARRLSLHGAGVTRPIEIALRATGIVVAVLAPLWPLFGSDIDGWWDWFLTTLANLGLGIILFGAGEAVRMIADIHGVLVRETEHDHEPVAEDEA